MSINHAGDCGLMVVKGKKRSRVEQGRTDPKASREVEDMEVDDELGGLDGTEPLEVLPDHDLDSDGDEGYEDGGNKKKVSITYHLMFRPCLGWRVCMVIRFAVSVHHLKNLRLLRCIRRKLICTRSRMYPLLFVGR